MIHLICISYQLLHYWVGTRCGKERGFGVNGNEIAERGVGSRPKKQQQTKKPQIGHRDAQVQELARLKNELRKSLAKSQGG